MSVPIVVSCLALVLSGCGGGSASGFEFVPADDVGQDPFVAGAAESVPVEFVEISDQLGEAADEAESQIGAAEADGGEGQVDAAAVIEARQAAVVDAAAEAGLAVTGPASRVGVGLYGGSGENVCDVVGMVNFFDQNPQIAGAWAQVQGIDPAEIPDYLAGLTAGYLLDDYNVVNHRLVGDTAEGFDATLEAGTAVMVDDQGIPRVRCLCGNPLAPMRSEPTSFINLDAEVGPGAEGANDHVPPVGWVVREGEFTAVPYGVDGFPESTAGQGARLFAGGPNSGQTIAEQTIRLTNEWNGRGYSLTARIGGYAAQEDNATLTLSFEDGGGNHLRSVTLGPVTAEDRGDQSLLKRVTVSDQVPQGAQHATLRIVMQRTSGAYNDGYIDSISVQLK